MLPSPKIRNPADGRGFEKNAGLDGLHGKYTANIVAEQRCFDAAREHITAILEILSGDVPAPNTASAPAVSGWLRSGH